MDFEQRLEKAIQRGRRRSEDQARAEARAAMTEEEFRRLHAQYRLELCEHIEACLAKLADSFPGFRFSTIVSEDGWGARIRRDDVSFQDGRRATLFSLLEVVVRPMGRYHVLELTAKGTIRNKEVFNRSYFEDLADVDPTNFNETVDNWMLAYAEQYAAER